MASDNASPTTVLSARKLCKAFGAIEVLHAIDLDIRSGEVHAILGENGAGKSTLVKLLSGFEPISSGELNLHDENGARRVDENWQHATAEREGVVLIHQEFNLVEQLTVTENIFLGHEIRKGLFLDKRVMRSKASEYLQVLECEINPDTPVHSLSVAEKQMVEIARTQSKRVRVLILDEPTAVLTQKESESLFALIERLRQQGVAIVYISHKLDEIERIANCISILRDGFLVGHYKSGELTQDDMARHMVGRELNSLFPNKAIPKASAEIVLDVSDLLPAGGGKPASFQLRRGEILGFAGLVGSGRTALMETIVGLNKPARNNSGTVSVKGAKVSLKNLAQARHHGIAYLTKDRKGSGLLLDKGLSMNFSLFALHKFSKVLINTRAEETAFEQAIDNFDIRIKNRRINAGNLSGGNQQKLLLAKILEAEPAIIIINEPTRGIDIGTKSQIYHFVSTLALAGHSIVLVSSDITEIIGLSHRVAVMFRDEISGILVGDEIEEHEIMRYATGLKSSAAVDLNSSRAQSH